MDDDDVRMGIGVSFVLFIIILVAVLAVCYNKGYETGQIDALNGKMFYVLKKQNDNTVVWREIK